jgi:hypothetical protein
VSSTQDAEFWGLFGWVEAAGFYVAIGDYDSQDAAEMTKELLDNKKKHGDLQKQETP